MKRSLLAILAAGLLLAADSPRDESAIKNEETAQHELLSLQGYWTMEAFEEEGQATPKEKLRRRTIFFGGSQFVVRQGDQIIQTGIHKLDAKHKPHHIDALVISGMNKGEKMLGIYELHGDTLKICFDTEGKERPTEFKSKPDSTYYAAVYKRLKPSTPEEIDIVGRYLCDGTELDGGSYSCLVEISRQGNAYSVKWVRGANDSYIGVGIRKGNMLSVSWLSRAGAGICVYQIEKGPRLSGEWTELGGIGAIRTETLSLMK